jgi:hypothetical protein
MIDFEKNIYVNDLFDIILRGKCNMCNKDVGRYIETGETHSNVKKIKKIL